MTHFYMALDTDGTVAAAVADPFSVNSLGTQVTLVGADRNFSFASVSVATRYVLTGGIVVFTDHGDFLSIAEHAARGRELRELVARLEAALARRTW